MPHLSDRIPIEELKKKFDSQQYSLKISRMPQRTHESFIEMADKMFASDYGMTLAFLIDQYFERIGVIEVMAEAIIDNQIRLNKLADTVYTSDTKAPEQKSREIRMANGRIVRLG